MLSFQPLLQQHFRHPSTSMTFFIFFSCSRINEHSSSFRSSYPKSSTSALQHQRCVLCRDKQHLCINCDILYDIVNCAFTVLLYCYCNAIVTSVCPSISKTHYHIFIYLQRTVIFFLITKIPTPWGYFTSPLLNQNCYYQPPTTYSFLPNE